MGLSQGRKSRYGPGPTAPAFWVVPAIFVLLGTLFAVFGDGGLAWLRYEREAIAAGEVWRLLSGHAVHLGWQHFLLNAAGIVLVWLLVGHAFSTRQWLLVTAAIVVGIDLGFWLLDRNLTWYVGASGVLHGLLFAGLVVGLRESPLESTVLLVVVGAKLLYEQSVGPLPGSETASGGPVVVNAHLYGAISGAAAGLLAVTRARRARHI